jgi:hypothetical protein
MRFKEKRSMKVYAGNDQNYKPVAQIRLQGKWLEEIGFVPGTQIEVKCENGHIEIIIANKDNNKTA